MGVRRGDVVIVAAPGDYGKPRPALIVQSDLFAETESVVVALLTTSQHPEAPLFRKPLRASQANGLHQSPDVMIDKLVTLPRTKIGPPVGRVDSAEMSEITAALALFLGM